MSNQEICKLCIMDSSDPNIVFNNDGVCNHCLRYETLKPQRLNIGDNAEKKVDDLLNKIKRAGKSKDYDCIIGVSGGVDSTYVAHYLVSKGLNPLAVHFDNGWNSELAVSNIEKMIDKLRIDLYTHVMDWNIFKNIQLAFLKSSTPDGEIPTDHAINAVLLKIANKFKIKYIINGMNYATEGMVVPAWSYGHSDWLYIKNIIKKFGFKGDEYKQLPHFSLSFLFYCIVFKRIKIISILNYITYDKSKVLETIKSDLEYKPYPQKHYESVYTRFFQGYYLVEKFGFDKRRGHFSDLVRSGQLSRKKALIKIQSSPYENRQDCENDIEFVLKKLDLEEVDLKRLINDENKSHLDYRNNESFINFMKKLYNYLRFIGVQAK